MSDEVAAAGVVVAIVSLAITLGSYIQASRQIKELQIAVGLFKKVTESFDSEVQLLREDVGLLRDKVNTTQDSQLKIVVEKEKLAQREKELAWRRLKDAGKAWKWLMDR